MRFGSQRFFLGNKFLRDYIKRIAFANVVSTKGRANQNHGLKEGIISIINMIVVLTKKYNHHLFVEVDSLMFKFCQR